MAEGVEKVGAWTHKVNLLTKLGKPFELVVADVLRELEPDSTVRQGEWVVGPDGRRELDVVIEGIVDGRPHSVLIECKDFNPNSTGPVGIGYVDALESKHRDLGMDVSFICSNAGFTTDAVRKAKRVGIGLISVLRRGDRRIRYQAMEEIYIRRVKVEHLSISLHGNDPIPLDDVPFEAVAYKGLPVGNWVIERALALIGSNPIVQGDYTASHKLHHPAQFTLPSGPVFVKRLDFVLTISGGWFAQQVTLDATSGLYDWLRRRFRRAPGPGTIELRNVDLEKRELVDCPPDEYLGVPLEMEVRRGEVWMWLLVIDGLEEREPVPDINSLVVEDDLKLTIPNLPPEAYTSEGT